ncbi:hypothetical protein F8165_30060 [Bacillus cereus]|uniref:Holliday junction resolvase RecU n=1 Tax=Bacillus cereus TaxID=1396 RepID=A0AAN6B591_BACCE|nr:hypothetical protein F8165_30060 [Bacillus cereus]
MAFDAKSTEKDTCFDLNYIKQHQLDYLEKSEKMGAICFFLIGLTISRKEDCTFRRISDTKKPIPCTLRNRFLFLNDICK